MKDQIIKQIVNYLGVQCENIQIIDNKKTCQYLKPMVNIQHIQYSSAKGKCLWFSILKNC